MESKSSSHRLRVAFQLGVVAVLALGLLNLQTLLDQYALATFHPSAAMVTIEGRLELTSAARAMFYRAQPQIDTKADFNRDCETQPHELELGCYFRGRICVLQIDNESLAPEMDVVTAHELLHAIWARMGASERKRIGDELDRIYAQLADDDLKQRMASYAQTEPGQQENELHSILGTEFAQLSPLLERHYAQYFMSRAQIVSAHAEYEGVFNSRRAELESELAQIRAQKAQLAVLNRQLDAYKASGQIDSYNALVPRQNRMVDDINKRIAVYRQGVDEYNALSKSLDSQQITDTETSAQ